MQRCWFGSGPELTRQTSDNRRQSWSATGHAGSPAIEQGRTRRDVRQSVRLQSVCCSSTVATDVRQHRTSGERRRTSSQPENAGEHPENAGEHHRLLDSVDLVHQCSWKNNRRTATSVNGRWTNASVRTDVDHLRGYVISRWIAAWIALH